LEVVDDGGLVLERLRPRQSLYSQIAVHTAFLMPFGVLHYFIGLGCVLPVSLQLFALRDAECLALELSALLMCSSRNIRASYV